MAFVRKKDDDYFYLVKSYRIGKKVRQKVLGYFGSAPVSAEKLEQVKARVEKRYPGLKIDWDKVRKRLGIEEDFIDRLLNRL